MFHTRRSILHWTLLSLSASLAWPAASASAGYVFLSGDEWLLSNQAFTDNPTNTTQFATNLATTIGGSNYLIYQNAKWVNSYDSSFQSLLTGMGKTVTTSTISPLTASMLSGKNAIFLAGSLGSTSGEQALLTQFVQSGGTVYLSLGTDNFTTAANEIAAWNPLVQNFGLSAGTTWFPDDSVYTIPIASADPMLSNNVTSLTWGYGQAITLTNPGNPQTKILFTGTFASPIGNQPLVGVSVVPEPAAMALASPTLLLLLRRRSRR